MFKKIGEGNGPENFQCRKLNNNKISPDNTMDSFIFIESKLAPRSSYFISLYGQNQLGTKEQVG